MVCGVGGTRPRWTAIIKKEGIYKSLWFISVFKSLNIIKWSTLFMILYSTFFAIIKTCKSLFDRIQDNYCFIIHSKKSGFYLLFDWNTSYFKKLKNYQINWMNILHMIQFSNKGSKKDNSFFNIQLYVVNFSCPLQKILSTAWNNWNVSFHRWEVTSKFYSNTILHDYNEAMPHQTIKWNHNIMNQIQNLNSHSHDQSVNQSSRLFKLSLVL